MQFKYKVIDEEMKIKEDILEAEDYSAAKTILLENGWQGISP